MFICQSTHLGTHYNSAITLEFWNVLPGKRNTDYYLYTVHWNFTIFLHLVWTIVTLVEYLPDLLYYSTTILLWRIPWFNTLFRGFGLYEEVQTLEFKLTWDIWDLIVYFCCHYRPWSNNEKEAEDLNEDESAIPLSQEKFVRRGS